jgi:hypothetical protein
MIIHHTDHSCSFLREYLPTNTRHALIPRISFFGILCLFSEIHFSFSIENICLLNTNILESVLKSHTGNLCRE